MTVRPVRFLMFLSAVLLALLFQLVDAWRLGPWSCVAVEIGGVYTKHRWLSRWPHDVKYYDVVSIENPSKHFEVGFDGTFPEYYIGRGALWVATGNVSRRPYYKLSGRCEDRPNR